MSKQRKIHLAGSGGGWGFDAWLSERGRKRFLVHGRDFRTEETARKRIDRFIDDYYDRHGNAGMITYMVSSHVGGRFLRKVRP